jgi:16S rRNA processing protein RimM
MSSFRSHKSSSPDSNNDPWSLLIGEITAPLGLKGEVRVFPHTDFPERFEGLREVGVRQGEGPPRVVAVTQARVLGRRISLKLDGIDTIEQAEALRGAHLLLPQSQAMPLEADAYYHHQLLGLEVVTTADESLGRITAILATGANDVYETPLALIPAVKAFVLEVDLTQGRMVVTDDPGLKKHESGA